VESLPLLAVLASGEPVFDRPDSHLHGGTVELLPEALATVSAKARDFIVATVEFGRILGERTCVATHPGDEIITPNGPVVRG